MKLGSTLARRHFLKAAGGATLALPMLPSLDTRAFGADAVVGKGRFLVTYTSDHGGILRQNMVPPDSDLTDKRMHYPGHEIRWGKLVGKSIDGERGVSTVLKAPTSVLTDRLLSRMMVVRGLDWPFYAGHHGGGHLGNIAANAGNSPDIMNVEAFPTIDEVIAWSPSFYTASELAGIKMRNVAGGSGGGGGGAVRTFGYSNPADRSGNIVQRSGIKSPRDLFDQIIGKITPTPSGPPPAPPKPIVDRFLEPYKNLEKNPRMSVQDKSRLNDWMARLSELQRRLSVQAPTLRSAACGSVTRPNVDGGPTYPDWGIERIRPWLSAMNDVIVAALLCGSTRIFTFGIVNNMSEYNDDWHQKVVHAGDQPKMLPATAAFFRHVMVDLATKLDVEYAPGRSLLDEGLIQWSQEAGTYTHDTHEMTMVTFGGAGGFFKPGVYLDLTNRTTNVTGKKDALGLPEQWYGFLYRQWLATVLLSMGIPSSEWQRGGWTGYGLQLAKENFAKVSAPGIVSNASTPLPVITGT